MRTLIYLLLPLLFIGCKKDDSPEGQLSGIWLFKESRLGSDTGGREQVVKAHPDYPMRLVLKKDGSFSIDNQPNLYSIQDVLQSFDRYQLLSNNEVRFYKTATTEEMIFDFEVGNELKLSPRYSRVSCSYSFASIY